MLLFFALPRRGMIANKEGLSFFLIPFRMSFKLRKAMRLTSKKSISALFETGNQVRVSPLLIKHKVEDREMGGAGVQVMFSVPKRKIKRAVDRNRIKRLLREAYRHEQEILKDSISPNKTLRIAVIYLRHTLPTHIELRNALGEALHKLAAGEQKN